jgi:hypothetical protein
MNVPRRRKWVRRLLLLVATVMVVVLGGAMVVVWMMRSQPAFYRPAQLTDAQRADAAKSAEDKFIRIQNEAARTRAAVSAQRRRASTSSSTQPIIFNGAPVTITFTEAEINAFFDKWSHFQNWKATYEPYIEDPVVILKDNRVILAARLKDPNLVLSLHFEPSIDETGRLQLELKRILGGMLPLPEAIMKKHQDRLTASLARRLPGWQHGAEIDAGGAVNASAIAASAGKLFVRIFRHEPVEPVLFLPVFGQKGSVPMRIQAMEVIEGAMTMTIHPMSRQEQIELLERIREPEPVGSPQTNPR